MQGQLANIQQFCMAVNQQPQATSTPLHSTSTRPTTAGEEMEVEAVAVMVDATNNRPGMVLVGRVHRNPHVIPLP